MAARAGMEWIWSTMERPTERRYIYPERIWARYSQVHLGVLCLETHHLTTTHLNPPTGRTSEIFLTGHRPKSRGSMHQSKIDHALAGPSPLPLTPILVVVSKATNRRRLLQLSRLSEARNAAAAAAAACCSLLAILLGIQFNRLLLWGGPWTQARGMWTANGRHVSRPPTAHYYSLESWSIEDSFFKLHPSGVARGGLHRYGPAPCVLLPEFQRSRRRELCGRTTEPQGDRMFLGPLVA